jgi:hypothetical protein
LGEVSERPAIPNVNWADHPGVWVDYLRDDREWLVRENERLRALLGKYPERALLCDDGHEPVVHFSECPLCSDEPQPVVNTTDPTDWLAYLEQIQQARLTWAMACHCTCDACERLSSVIRRAQPQTGEHA